uniref:(northern house mosquito) hypothetical protein n=1 Tax=Culex pipiens TaxID=7175 RepID=A0A8D8CVI5_CULPI
MKDLYMSENQITDAKLQQIMFDLTVNVIPLDNKKERIGPLGVIRNILIHNFQQYNTTERLREMKRLTFPLKSNLFKYYYAKKVQDILKCGCLHENYESLELKIVDALNEFEEDFNEKTHIASADDANSFEYFVSAFNFSSKR